MNKCSSCRIKTLVLIKCKCCNEYCPKCLHAEKHSCTFDHRRNAQEDLSKKNPHIKSKKIEEI